MRQDEEEEVLQEEEEDKEVAIIEIITLKINSRLKKLITSIKTKMKVEIAIEAEVDKEEQEEAEVAEEEEVAIKQETFILRITPMTQFQTKSSPATLELRKLNSTLEVGDREAEEKE